ncbi:MAG: membrane protein insertion efficiency factor YidD [Gammaproteobacteria bacterium]|nr:MAG: membrane protein insertion efficiency factor YidD [Gammaproteobacteria bacterium]
MAVRALIRAYQITLSPFIGNQCRFHPSCSHYALEAIDAHGAAKGSWLALKRLARCHPFHPGGIEPVPAKSAQTVGERKNHQASGACPQPKEN